MRADARRNRERIVASALELFAARGCAVGMDDIAREAGLGVGTLYRHFPDRRALVEEIAVSALLRFRDRIAELREGGVPAGEALALAVEHCAGEPFALIKSLAGDGPAPAGRLEVQAEVDALLAKLAAEAQAEGAVRRDIGPAEVIEIVSLAVCRPGVRAGDPVIRVMLDGLRARA
ncbi:TetR family transcriptional regulator [Actinomadura sp. LD22]|uniref:TetR family transcriptional regulator n=1 Tax=Actinomadura physcomitrii TaxID=2650748 RepID=A0A6I4MEU1_9ACTN|nr:TetR/AcrR family transcriptional regulator [Actinomadura physcomitrii]MWA01129.1 TetR family transcriptional regulator [Actinomadura physcomitrii]